MTRLSKHLEKDLNLSSNMEGRSERRGLIIWLSFIACIIGMIMVGCIFSLKDILIIGLWLMGTVIAIIICILGYIGIRIRPFINTYDRNKEDKS